MTDDEAKLVFGTVFSLRNMARKLGGEDDRYVFFPSIFLRIKLTEVYSFVSYSTNQYKLHFYETPTNTKFVMITDCKSHSMRVALQQIYINLYVEYGGYSKASPLMIPTD